MQWYIFAIISVVTISVANILQKKLMKDDKNDPIAYSIVFHILLTGVIFLYAWWKGFVSPPLMTYPLNFLLSSVLWGLTSFCLFKANQSIPASEITILASFNIVVTVVGSLLFLNEGFGWRQLIGILFVFTSVIIVSWHSQKFRFQKGHWLVVLQAVFSGIAVVNDVYVINDYDAVSYTTIMSLLPAFVLIALSPRSLITIKHYLNSRFIFLMLPFCLLYGVQAICYYLAIENGAGSYQMNTLFKSEVVLTILLAIFILKEHNDLLKKNYSCYHYDCWGLFSILNILL